ncbi:MAG: hypothetical protein EA399_18285 [Desulfovibrionales bacterium]|nr:MAG: hypothetical protein EA399_18285 [Desulfovibrionales bacterium]
MNQVITFWSSIREEFRRTYIKLFHDSWPAWLAGIFLAILALMIFLWDNMWGITGGFRNWGDNVFYMLGIYSEQPEKPWLSNMSVSNLGLLLGAFGVALMAGQFKIRTSSWYEHLKGLVGGALMGIGAAFAAGCNIGGFYNAIGMFSMGGYAMMIGLGIGAYIGLRILIWEMMNIPQQSLPQMHSTEMPGKPFINWSRIAPYAGGLVLLSIPAAFYLYAVSDRVVLGGLLFFGALIGITMQRARLCFARAFREPFMTGNADMVRVIALSLIIYGMGSAVIKFNWLQPEMAGVYHPFWFGSLLGGIIFGIGMLLAGGCGTGSLWRAGEGHVKLIIAVVSFALFNSLGFAALERFGIREKLGSGVFMPDVFGWPFALMLYGLVALGWALWAIWNEKTEKFVIF